VTRRDVVAVVQPFVPTYRVPLFDAIAHHLEPEGLALEVWHAQPTGIVAARGNSTSGAWSVPIRQHRLTVKRRNVTWRNVHREARDVACLVHGLASSNLETYALAADPAVNLMLWGHGRNFTARSNRLDDLLEGWLCRRASHLFAYTEAGASHLRDAGLSTSKITVVRNSTDTAGLQRHRASVTPQVIADRLRELDLTGRKVGLFVGAFDEPKMLPFLFDATDRIAAVDPTFALVMAGAGPLDEYVATQAADRAYVRLIGRLETEQLATLAAGVKLILMPGRVGLVAVDSLALGLPLITTEHDFHAPEIEYLTPETSVWTSQTPQAYAEGVLTLLGNDVRRRKLATNGLGKAGELSADSAGRRFVAGILQGLER